MDRYVAPLDPSQLNPKPSPRRYLPSSDVFINPACSTFFLSFIIILILLPSRPVRPRPSWERLVAEIQGKFPSSYLHRTTALLSNSYAEVYFSYFLFIRLKRLSSQLTVSTFYYVAVLMQDRCISTFLYHPRNCLLDSCMSHTHTLSLSILRSSCFSFNDKWLTSF